MIDKKRLQKLQITTLVIGLGLFFLPGTVLALSKEQVRTMDSGIRYFNVEKAIVSSSCGTTTALTGSENAEKIFNFFISKGFQPFQAAGLMGNMQAESGLNPKRVQGTPTPSGDQDNITVDGHTGYGLVQWTSKGRQQGLADLAATNNTISGDLGTQLQYIMQELEGPYKSDLDKLLASTDIITATNVILMGYERPKNPDASRATRISFAQDILTRYGSGTSATTTSDSVTSCGTSGTGEVIGSISLPVDRHWYDEHPDWFTKPHHDYPAADIPVPSGTSVYSMTAGKVLKAPVGNDCGIGVLIDAGNGIQFVYCHGSDGGSVVSAKVGDEVKPGQMIMHSDNTGHSTGPHLHVQIKINGVNHCPQNLFVGIANGTPPDLYSLPTSGCTYGNRSVQ